MNNYVLYHGNCMDGFGAAYAAWKHFGQDAIYIAQNYKPDTKSIDLPQDFKNNELYLVDFCYNIEILEYLLKNNNNIYILDHHKTAQDNIEQLKTKLLPFIFAFKEDGYVIKPSKEEISKNKKGHKLLSKLHSKFKMKESGAGITWRYFHNDKSVPTMIEYIEDSDLWEFKLPYSKAVRAYMQTVDRTFEEYDKLCYDMDDKTSFKRIIGQGSILIKYQEILMKDICNKAILQKDENNHTFIFTNTSILISEVGNKLLELHPEADYSKTFFYTGTGNQYSLRSRAGGDMDVSKIAEEFHGGGHKHAAGYSIQGEL